MEDLLNFSFQSHSHSPKRNHYDCGPSSHQGSQASYSRGHGDSGSDSPSAGPVSPQQQASNLVKRGGWMKEEILDCRRRQQGTGVLGQRVRQTDKTAGLRKRLEIWSPGLWPCEWKVTCLWAGKFHLPELVCHSQYGKKGQRSGASQRAPRR